ncbi:hypothetical protein CLIB1444_04S00826 [[Candida] jaroonii]|uniref:Uncharacterized protein n=1 Tax=[Candida] jaroonii TaxID=467808 RepID=A0ACA9Y762_9ASCO|nr:hypothetical protein CLIB1444_04S00826 [[Candida] jaroonii]
MEDKLQHIEKLQSNIENLLTTNESISQLLQQPNKSLQRQSILDSYAISQFNRDVKDMKSSIHEDSFSYNKKLSLMFKHSNELEIIMKEYEQKSKLVKLPDLKISTLTLKQYDESLHAEEQNINIKDFFTVDKSIDKPLLDFDSFKKLVNLEYRNRVERMVKYQILLNIKSEIDKDKDKWSKRNVELERFLQRDVEKIVKTVENIRNDEMDVEDDERDDMNLDE